MLSKRILILRDKGCSENEIYLKLAKIFSKKRLKRLIKRLKDENIFSITPSDEIYINTVKQSNISFISFSFTKPLAVIMDKEKNIYAQINTNPFYVPTPLNDFYSYSDLVGSTLYVYLYIAISKFLHEKCIIEVDYFTKGCNPSNSIKQLEQLGAENIHIIKNETGGHAVKCKIQKKTILSFMAFREISPNEYSALVNHDGEASAWLVRNESPLEKDDYLLQDVLFKNNNKITKIIIDGVAILNNGTRDMAEGPCFVTKKASIQKYIIKSIIKWAKKLKIRKYILRSFSYRDDYEFKEHKREVILI